MMRRELLLLLVPSAIFLIVAAASFRSGSLLAPDRAATKRNIEALQQKAHSGEFGPTPDRLVGLLRDSWYFRDELRGYIAREQVIAGWGLLLGVMVQVYVVIRVRGRMCNSAVQATAAPART